MGESSDDETTEPRFFELAFRDDGVVWLKRQPRVFESLEDLRGAYETFLAAVDDHLLDVRIKSGAIGTKKRVPMGWLYDVREAPTQRNDPAFEDAIKALRPELLGRGPLVVLVKTAAGRMQLSRMASSDNQSFAVMDDFDAAVAWLLDQMGR